MKMLDKVKSPAEIQTTTRFKALVYGKPSSGKSYFATTFPRCLVIDTENGIKGPHAKNIEASNGSYIFINVFDELMKIILELLSTKHDYKTLVIDPITVIYADLLDFYKEKIEHKAINSGKDPDQALAYSPHYNQANLQMKKLFRLLDRLDMNVIITAHLKDNYKDQKVIGETFDAYKKMDYIFDLTIEAYKSGEKHMGKVIKRREDFFKDNECFELSYSNIFDRYPKIENEVATEELASAEEVEEFYRLAKLINLSEEKRDDWLKKAKSSTVNELSKKNMIKCLDFMNEQISGKKNAVAINE